MASISAFNDMLSQFLSELTQTFPEEKTIKKYESSFSLIRKSNPRKIVESYMQSVGPFQDRIMARDDTLFSDGSFAFLGDIDLGKRWPNPSDNTRGCIWQYVQTLMMLGVTITALPADTLAAIEGVAEKTAGQMAAGGGGNEADMMKMFSSLLGKLPQ